MLCAKWLDVRHATHLAYLEQACNHLLKALDARSAAHIAFQHFVCDHLLCVQGTIKSAICAVRRAYSVFKHWVITSIYRVSSHESAEIYLTFIEGVLPDLCGFSCRLLFE